MLVLVVASLKMWQCKYICLNYVALIQYTAVLSRVKSLLRLSTLRISIILRIIGQIFRIIKPLTVIVHCFVSDSLHVTVSPEELKKVPELQQINN